MYLLQIITNEGLKGMGRLQLSLFICKYLQAFEAPKRVKNLTSLYYISQQKGLAAKEEGYEDVLQFIHLKSLLLSYYQRVQASQYLHPIYNYNNNGIKDSTRDWKKGQQLVYELTQRCNILQGPRTLSRAQNGVVFPIHRRAQLREIN